MNVDKVTPYNARNTQTGYDVKGTQVRKSPTWRYKTITLLMGIRLPLALVILGIG
jgi:hypothetical protein